MDAKSTKVEKAVEWYIENKSMFKSLGGEVNDIIRHELEEQNIFYHGVESRAKDIESYKEKCKKDKYKDPIRNITDMTGVRVTAYTNNDVEKICSIIEEEFDIDKNNSINKANEKDVNEFGYLSVHYIAKLKSNYMSINKYSRYKDLRFEIQVRTILQHAWSEIEHDRNYKFKGTLPKDLKRRFFMIAGVLEMVDREFEALTSDIEMYNEEVNRDVGSGHLDLELTNVSIYEFFKNQFGNVEFDFELEKNIFDELESYGVLTISDLKDLIDKISKPDLKILLEYDDEILLMGLLRNILIINDAELYFRIWKNDWDVDEDEVNFFKKFNVDLKNI